MPSTMDNDRIPERIVRVVSCDITVSQSAASSPSDYGRAGTQSIVAHLRDETPLDLLVALSGSGFRFELPTRDGRYVHPLTSEKLDVTSRHMHKPWIRLTAVLETDLAHKNELDKLVSDKLDTLLFPIGDITRHHGVTVIAIVSVQGLS